LIARCTARAAVGGDEEIALALLAVAGLQLRQVLDVDVDEAEGVVLERVLDASRARRWRPAAS
jgi:hypothetical protein